MYALYEVLSFLEIVSSFAILILVAYATWLYATHVRSSKAKYTIELIDRLRINQASSFAYKKAAEEFELMQNLNSYALEQPALFDRLADLEALAIAVRKGLIDEDLMKDYAGRTIINAFLYSKDVIYSIREKTGRPEIYSDLEALASRWSAKGGRDAA